MISPHCGKCSWSTDKLNRGTGNICSQLWKPLFACTYLCRVVVIRLKGSFVSLKKVGNLLSHDLSAYIFFLFMVMHRAHVRGTVCVPVLVEVYKAQVSVLGLGRLIKWWCRWLIFLKIYILFHKKLRFWQNIFFKIRSYYLNEIWDDFQKDII